MQSFRALQEAPSELSAAAFCPGCSHPPLRPLGATRALHLPACARRVTAVGVAARNAPRRGVESGFVTWHSPSGWVHPSKALRRCCATPARPAAHPDALLTCDGDGQPTKGGGDGTAASLAASPDAGPRQYAWASYMWDHNEHLARPCSRPNSSQPHRGGCARPAGGSRLAAAPGNEDACAPSAPYIVPKFKLHAVNTSHEQNSRVPRPVSALADSRPRPQPVFSEPRVTQT
jgi:hypothetical protein